MMKNDIQKQLHYIFYSHMKDGILDDWIGLEDDILLWLESHVKNALNDGFMLGWRETSVGEMSDREAININEEPLTKLYKKHGLIFKRLRTSSIRF